MPSTVRNAHRDRARETSQPAQPRVGEGAYAGRGSGPVAAGRYGTGTVGSGDGGRPSDADRAGSAGADGSSFRVDGAVATEVCPLTLSCSWVTQRPARKHCSPSGQSPGVWQTPETTSKPGPRGCRTNLTQSDDSKQTWSSTQKSQDGPPRQYAFPWPGPVEVQKAPGGQGFGGGGSQY